MKPKTILRLSKAVIFILALTFHGLKSHVLFLAQILFAIILAMYLIELYKGVKQ